MTRIVVLTPAEGEMAARMRAALAPGIIEIVHSVAALQQALAKEDAVVLSFGTGEIVPEAVLKRLRLPIYNLHAASPDFPGRDPHHHAVYRNARDYGATLHLMTPQVDAGDIVGVEQFIVPEGVTPAALLEMSNDASIALLGRVAPQLMQPSPMPALPGERWGRIRTRRKDLQTLSSVSPLISEKEFRHRERSLASPKHVNLRTEILGRVFRHDPAAAPLAPDQRYAEFTEAGFARLLDALIAGDYRFAWFGEERSDRHVLWRHDVDASMHRAARLAAIEAERRVRATYFLNPRNPFYNLLEPAVMAQTRSILAAGHRLGLHFDAGAFEVPAWTRASLEDAVASERRLLETITGSSIGAVSWHNPGVSNLLDFADDVVAGLSNAYSARLKASHVYCSDSNGYWRHRPMVDVIAEGHERLHLLTHPDWWTPEPMSADDRMERALLGRARAVRLSHYDQLAGAGRKQTPDDTV